MMKIDVKGVIVSDGEAEFYDWIGFENTSPKVVNEAIQKANGEKLDIYINSGGGDIFAGSEIYSALRSYTGQVAIHVVGLAASAASVIACAGKSDISPTAMVMVHNVSTVASGDHNDMEKQSEVLKKANKAIAAAYVAKSGMSESDALAMMDKETWLPANEAVEKGLIDSVSEPQNLQLVASFGSGMLSADAIQKIRSTMENKQKTRFQAQLELLKMEGKI